MADSDRDPGRAATAAKKLYNALGRVEVLAAVYIVLLCAGFFLETRAHRNLFYLLVLPVFLLHLWTFDWARLKQSAITWLTLCYLGYFLLSGLWSDGFAWAPLADLLRVSLLLSLFFLMTLRLGTGHGGFPERLSFWFAATAGASLLAGFAAAAIGRLPFGRRFTGFGLAEHPIVGSTLYGVALLLCTFVLLPRAKDWPTRLAWLAVIALCAAFMLLSSSRGPLIALAAALAVGFAFADRRRAVVVLALVTAALALGVALDLQPIELLYQRSQSGHFAIWQQAVAAIAEHPWLGYGSLADLDFVGKHGPSRSPHNLLLANHLYGGLPATLLLAALLAVALRQAWRARRAGRPVYLVLLAFGLVAALFDTRSLVQNLGREWITLWLPIGLLAAEDALWRNEKPS